MPGASSRHRPSPVTMSIHTLTGSCRALVRTVSSLVRLDELSLDVAGNGRTRGTSWSPARQPASLGIGPAWWEVALTGRQESATRVPPSRQIVTASPRAGRAPARGPCPGGQPRTPSPRETSAARPRTGRGCGGRRVPNSSPRKRPCRSIAPGVGQRQPSLSHVCGPEHLVLYRDEVPALRAADRRSDRATSRPRLPDTPPTTG